MHTAQLSSLLPHELRTYPRMTAWFQFCSSSDGGIVGFPFVGLLEWVHTKQPSITLSVCLCISLWACGHKGKIQSIAMWVHFAQDNTGRCSRISTTTWLNIEYLIMIVVPSRWWHRGGGGGGGEGGASYRRKWALFFVSCCEMGRMQILQNWLGIAKFGEE